MAGQEISRRTSNDPSACIWLPVSVPTRLDGDDIEGGEPIITILRCSDLVVILAIGIVVMKDLR